MLVSHLLEEATSLTSEWSPTNQADYLAYVKALIACGRGDSLCLTTPVDEVEAVEFARMFIPGS